MFIIHNIKEYAPLGHFSEISWLKKSCEDESLIRQVTVFDCLR